MTSPDHLQRFLFIDHPVRGEIVRLHHSFQTVLARHPYPPMVAQLLGETLAAASLLSGLLKFSGWLILQLQGKGPMRLTLAQVNHQRQIRGLAHCDTLAINTPLAELLTNAQLAITSNSAHTGERYQSIVKITATNLAQSLENYFAQSEQLPTYFYLTANATTAAGFLLQAMPTTAAEERARSWEHLTHLAQTLTSTELLTLPNTVILSRLFHEEDIQMFTEEPINFHCNCDQQRMEQALLTLGYEEAMELLKNDLITINCEFCNNQQQFNAREVAKLFART